MRIRLWLPLAASLVAAGPLAAKNDTVDIGPRPQWVTQSEPLAVPADTEGLVYIRQQDILVHLDQVGQSTYSGQLIKLLHPQALQMGNLALTWNPAVGAPTVHALRIHRDGAVIDVLANTRFEVLRREDQLEQAMLDGLLTAILRIPDLRVGDELEWAYTIPSSDPVLGNASAGLLAFSPSPPSGRFRLGLSWTDGQEPKLKLTPEFERLAQRKPSSLDIRLDEPAILTPPQDAPPRYSWQRILEYSDFGSWGAISQRFAGLYSNAADLESGSQVRQEAARIAATHRSPRAQAQAALELVQQQVRYIYVGLDGGNLDPAPADATWSRRYGDCKGKTVLLMALLKELGIEAEPVLVNNSGGDDGLDGRLPNPGLFDHVLVRAKIDGKTYWLDGTLPPVAEASEEPLASYRWVLPLAKSGGTLERIRWKPAAVPDELVLYEIDARAGFDAPAKIVYTTIQRGPKALAEYVQLSALSRSQLESSLRNSFIGGGSWNSVETVDYRFDRKARASILKISGSGPVDWDDDGNGQRSLSLPGGGFSPPSRRQRAGGQDQQAPFYNEPEYDCRVTTVRFPEGTNHQDWSTNSWFDNMMYGQVYYRAFERRDGAMRMIRGFRVEEPEISADKAQRDNERLSRFDNSMAWIYYNPGQKEPEWNPDQPVPATWEIDWTAPAVPCLPPDLKS